MCCQRTSFPCVIFVGALTRYYHTISTQYYSIYILLCKKRVIFTSMPVESHSSTRTERMLRPPMSSLQPHYWVIWLRPQQRHDSLTWIFDRPTSACLWATRSGCPTRSPHSEIKKKHRCCDYYLHWQTRINMNARCMWLKVRKKSHNKHLKLDNLDIYIQIK